MQDKELVVLYRELYLKCKSQIELFQNNLDPEVNFSFWDTADENTKSIKELEDQINNKVLDELVRLGQKMGGYDIDKDDLYYK